MVNDFGALRKSGGALAVASDAIREANPELDEFGADSRALHLLRDSDAVALARLAATRSHETGPVVQTIGDADRLPSEERAALLSEHRMLVGNIDDEMPPPIPLESELEVAEAFVARYGNRLRYCARLGGWLVWDGSRWVHDGDGAVLRYAAAFARELATAANAIEDIKDRAGRLRFIIALEKRRGLENFVAIAQSHERVAIGDPNRFDADRMLLNVKNGTLDLCTGELLPPNPGNLITKVAGTRYIQDASCERWERFLGEVFAGDDDLIRFMQRLVGYALTGETREQVLAVMYGPGANGKSTFLGVIEDLFGDYAATSAASTFLSRRPDAQTNDLARLAGARFVSAIEMNDGRTLDEGFVKSATGGDRIVARFLYAEPFEFTPSFKIALAVNHRPIIRGVDEGIWRRIRLIPFAQRFSGEHCNPKIREELRKELEGILAWAVRGCLEWQQHGLGNPDAVAKATSAYRSDSDVLGQFIDSCCIEVEDAVAFSGDLYRAYRSWAESGGEKPMTANAFSRCLTDRGYDRKKNRRGQRQFLRLGLRQDDGT